MKTYIFTYFNGDDLETFYKAQEFVYTGHRLSQGISCFADFFNSLSGYKEFSSCYKVSTGRFTEYRHFKSYYFSLFKIVRPSHLLGD